MGAVGVIPARWASTRFPGKSLASVGGKPLVLWVLDRASQAASLDEVLVATDDTRIQAAVQDAGGRAVMTRPDHPSGTDRIAEAVQAVDADIVVNIQGDEPMIDPALIDSLVRTLQTEPEWDMATAVVPIHDEQDIEDSSVVKAVWADSGQALYFSRSVIPCMREKDVGLSLRESLYWRHIGIYAYRRDFLEKMVKSPPCAIEEAEKLEQLRALHLGARIKVLKTQDVGPGVDNPGDVEKAEEAMKKAGLL